MSNSEIPNLNKDENGNIENKVKDETTKLKEKGKDKEKETSNLLEEDQNILNESKNNNQRNINNNELFYFIILAIFVFIVSRLVQIKVPTPEQDVFLDEPWIHGIESNETINSFENRYRRNFPKLTLELINDFPTLTELFNARVLYIFDKNLTNKYIHHIRDLDGVDESPYQKPLYKNLVPNETFSENRANYINTEKFVDLCYKEKLISGEKIYATDKPLISIIIPCFNKKKQIMRTIRSLQNQSLKNIEIIIVDDFSSENATDLYNSLLATDPRIRVFYHQKVLGLFRSRLNGFLYSRGKYILHFVAGDLLADNYVLEDLYNLITKYSLDSIRFSFKTYQKKYKNNYNSQTMKYPNNVIKIRYGPVKENPHIFGFGTIWNRLIRANILTKGLDLIDWHIINAYKNFGEDIWWNELANHASYSHLVFNRIGYIYHSNVTTENELKISTREERDSTMREFVYFWLFDYQILPRDNNKRRVINKLKMYNLNNGTFDGTPLNLNYITTNFTAYEHLLKALIEDPCVKEDEKPFIGELLNNYYNKLKNLSMIRTLNN